MLLTHKNCILILIFSILFLKTQAQKVDIDLRIVEKYAKKYNNKSIKIDTLKYSYVSNWPEPNVLRHIIEYKIPYINQNLTFIRNEEGVYPDTIIFKKKKFTVKGDPVKLWNDPSLKLDGRTEKLYLVKFKQKKYLIFETGIMGATGKGAAWSPYLIFDLNNNSKLICAVGKEMRGHHFIDYKGDGILDLIYHNRNDEDCILNLETGSIIKLNENTFDKN